MVLHLGTVPYLNALPLVDALSREPSVTLHAAVPDALARRLREGHLDLALVSSVELFRRPELGWIPGPAITSEGPVRSILLYLSVPPERIARVGLDTSSRTAAALAQICLVRFLGVGRPHLVPAPPDVPLGDVPADAVLRIGDPALATDPEGREVIDLGALWTDATGLPFVWALWLGSRERAGGTLGGLLRRARDAGVLRRGELAEDFARRHGLHPHATRRYLEEAIGFRLGARERQGLQLFGRLAHELHLVDVPELPAPLEPLHEA